MNEPQAYLLLQQLRETPTAELYPALTDNLSTACNSPLCVPRGISTSQEVVKQSVHFQIQPCLSLVKLCFPPPHKYCPFHLLNHCLEASFPKGVEQSLKWLTQGSGNQNLWPESYFSCGIWYSSTQHFGRRWPLKEHRIQNLPYLSFDLGLIVCTLCDLGKLASSLWVSASSVTQQ